MFSWFKKKHTCDHEGPDCKGMASLHWSKEHAPELADLIESFATNHDKIIEISQKYLDLADEIYNERTVATQGQVQELRIKLQTMASIMRAEVSQVTQPGYVSAHKKLKSVAELFEE